LIPDALRAQGLTKRYGAREVVRNLDLRLDAGEVVGLLGPNGAGKTTSFNMIVGRGGQSLTEKWQADGTRTFLGIHSHGFPNLFIVSGPQGGGGSFNFTDAIEQHGGNARRITITSRVPMPGRLEVAVSDTGPGLDAEIADRVFDSFATTKADGMGLGLSICKSIIEAHEGEISIRQGPDRGTTFSLVLPTPPGT